MRNVLILVGKPEMTYMKNVCDLQVKWKCEYAMEGKKEQEWGRGGSWRCEGGEGTNWV